MAIDNFLTRSIKSNPLVWTTTFLSLVLLILNSWLTIRLIPSEQKMRDIEGRIESVELRNRNTDPLVERFFKVEEKQKNFEEQTSGDIRDIKDSVGRIEQKFDQHILR